MAHSVSCAVWWGLGLVGAEAIGETGAVISARRALSRGIDRGRRRVRTAVRVRWAALRSALAGPSPERDTFYLIVKSALAATIAWEIAINVPLGEGQQSPWLAPLSAMLIVGTTVTGTFVGALQRVAATVVGVLVSYWTGRLLGLHWWSILLVVIGARFVGNWRRFGTQGTQVAITAILILTLASTREGYATARIVETLLGAAVGLVINFVVAPPVHLRSARESLADLAAEIAGILSDVGTGLRETWPPADTEGWLSRARDLDDRLVDVRESVDRGTESIRFNPRRMIADVAPDLAVEMSDPWLRPAQRTLEHVAIQTRGITRMLVDQEFPGQDVEPSEPDRRFLDRYAELLELAARAVHRFGELGDDAGDDELRRLITDGVRHGYALRRQLRIGAMRDDTLWHVYGALLVDVERLFNELR